MEVEPHLDLGAVSTPGSRDELVEAITELARMASRWSDVVGNLYEPTRRLVGTAAAASVSLAARRAEEAFLELEMTLGDVRAARRSLPLATSRGEDDRPMV
ncbi:hypothetical protein GCM10022243_45520 [Saccharothrix violaceirubra]|uniref:Excreted virulence factor EspC (Type VII ESX diderm) n=1 Tax=Saccharothrix violaceirubra TaxID=413306 RepID=A0A7W7T0Z8_9PSEU|nr:hypothetical protein [Saccharothrix violaceirubra]MBB4964558.1 hypothetical protein [Saccharothrix violaceirubra]